MEPHQACAGLHNILSHRDGPEQDLLRRLLATIGAEENMKKIGKVLRDANSGLGLVTIDGQHFQFGQEGVWRGDRPPISGMRVQVEFAPDASITSMRPVLDVEEEEPQALMHGAGEKGNGVASAAVARFGLGTLTCTALLIVGWFFFSAISVQTLLGKANLTFWQLLGLLNSGAGFEAAMEGRGGPGAGFYGFLALAALAGPFLPFVWKDRRAPIGGLLPLVFMIGAAVLLRSSLNDTLGANVSGPLGDLARQAREETMKTISLGAGSYVSSLASLYLAGGTAKKFLLARALDTEHPGRVELSSSPDVRYKKSGTEWASPE